jgi:pilus assembly protein CpaC
MPVSPKHRSTAQRLIATAAVMAISFGGGLAHADSKVIPNNVTLYAGQALVQNAPGPLERIAVGDGKVLEVKIIGERELVMIGEKPGETSLQLWMTDGRQRSIGVHVTLGNSEQLAETVRQMLGEEKNVTITPINGNVIVSGSNLSAGQVANIEAIRKMYPQVLNFSSVDPVEMRPTVLMQVRIMEFDKKAMTDIGIKWDTAIDGPTAGVAHEWATNPYFRVLPGTTGGANGIGASLPTTQPGMFGPLRVPGTAGYFGLITSITSRINLAMQTGNAWELAAPQLSARSGGTADFLVGGQVPIPVSSGFGQTTVEYKDYGIKLHMEPLVNGEGDIAAKIETEISKVDPSITVQGYPAFLTRRGNTELNVHEGDTIVISGLVDANAAKTVDKVPGLGQVPVLGELFKSRAFQANRTDLVVFVTPHVIDAHARINQDLIRRSEQLREDFRKNAGADIVN